MSALPDLHTANDVAEVLRKSVDWVQRAAGRGDLPGVRLGKDWRFTDEDVALFLERRRNAKRSARQAAARKREAKA